MNVKHTNRNIERNEESWENGRTETELLLYNSSIKWLHF